eukprot:gene3319-1657_t
MARQASLLCFFLLAVATSCYAQQMPGGIVEMTKDEIEKDDILQEGVTFAVTEYNLKTNSRLIATKILQATRQVVAGIKYAALVEMRPRLCVHDPSLKIAPCPPELNYPTKCIFEILHQAWKPSKYALLSTRCLRG